MLRIPHCLDNRLTDGGKIVSPTHPSHFIPQYNYYFSVSAIHFCKRLSKPQGLVQPEGLGKFKNPSHRDSNPRPSGLLRNALSTTLPRAQRVNYDGRNKQWIINACVSTEAVLAEFNATGATVQCLQ
jgi:hypothetical protein